MTIKTAVIGLGIMGRRMAEHMLLHPGYTLSALWDPSDDACATARAMLSEAPISTSPEDAMSDADLVYLACPPVSRRAYAMAAADAGRAVFLEKPLGVNVEETEALVAHLRDCGVPTAVNFTQAAGVALADVSRAASDGSMGKLIGADIVVTYPAWPRAWQSAADWLRFREEGGMTREVISHFLFFAERVLGPLKVISAQPAFPADPSLCETAMLARLENAECCPVTVVASVGGAQPDRQELTIKGTKASHRISEFYLHDWSQGGAFTAFSEPPTDPRATSLKAQLDDLLLRIKGNPHRLATPEEALRVQKLVERMLEGTG